MSNQKASKRPRNPTKSPNSTPSPPGKQTKTEDMEEMMKEMMLEMRKDREERREEMKRIERLLTENRESWEKEKEEMHARQRSLEVRLNYFEKTQKRNNIVMSNYNPKEKSGRKLLEEVEQFLQEKTEEPVMIETVQKFNSKAGERYVVKMKNLEDKLVVLRKKKMLFTITEGEKNHVYVNDDLIREDQEIQKKGRDFCKEARKQGKEAKIGYRKIFIDGKEHKWNNDKQEFSDNK